MRRKKKYFNFLDGLREIKGPDTIPLLVKEFPELNKETALDLMVKWAEREAIK